MAATRKTTPNNATAGSKKTSAKKRAVSLGSKSSASDVVDEQLARYRSMRNFSVTDEPSGNQRKALAKGLPFCVQKHAASHLHYDFRLGWNSVLKSWAVAKGPSYFPGDKRLAVQVEDHPLEYGGFEGIIPKGQYGGGTVMLWDEGTWEPQAAYPNVDAGLRDGSLKFILHGKKLKGKWALIRMKGKWAMESKPNWLLIKEHDEFEQKQDETPITETEQKSVITGRTMAEIAQNEDHIWNSRDTHSSAQAWLRTDVGESNNLKETKVRKLHLDEWLKDSPVELQPAFLAPKLATMAEIPPSGADWLHELKLDGYRIQARKSGDEVRMLTRTGLDWTERMKSVAKEISKLPTKHVTLDGELVVLAQNGTTSFADLQASMQDGAKHTLTYFAFDLLHAEGKNVRDLPLIQRKEKLAMLLEGADHTQLRFSEHLETGGEELLRKACKLGAEGIVSKLASSKYVTGRSTDWIKTKCLHEQEFVVGGYTLPTNGIRGVGALLLGYHRDGALIYAGKTGTGFTQKTHRILRDRVEELGRTTSPFQSVSEDARKGSHWIEPEMVVQVRFATWTADDLVRQAAFLGVREDKTALEVVREEAEASIEPRRRRGPNTYTTRKLDHDKDSSAHELAPVRLTHPNKVLDAESGMTKQMLADYYWAIAERMLAEIKGRPVSLVRCPDGIGKTSFFQKHVNATLPGNIISVAVPNKKSGKIEQYITIDTAEALAGLAQIGVLELHPWGSRNHDLEKPDRLIFDLDPDEELRWQDVTAAAEEVRRRLQEIGLKSFAKTTGGKGLHIVAPIEPQLHWPEIKEFARTFVTAIEADAPQRYLTKMTKSARKGKIYLDYLRNEREATSVAAYSPRVRAGVPVSLPLSWNELRNMSGRPVFRVVDFPAWQSRLKNDPWKNIESVKQSLPV